MPSHPLSPREIAAIVAIVVVWGVNNAAAEVATAVMPPLLVGALRFAIAAVFLVPFVRPPFPNPKSLLILCVCGGPLHFGLIYFGFSLTEDLSPFAVSLQLWIPLTAVIAWLLLGERLPKPAIVGLVLAFAGVVVMVADPRAFRDWDAILVGLLASVAWALTTVIARRTTSVPPLKMQGLLSLVTAPTLGLGAALFEPDSAAALRAAPPLVWASIVFAALISTVIATGLLFWLVQRREAGRVTPCLLSTPVVSILIGVSFLGDVLTPQILVGAAITIGGVAVVALAERGLRAGATRGQ